MVAVAVLLELTWQVVPSSPSSTESSTAWHLSRLLCSLLHESHSTNADHGEGQLNNSTRRLDSRIAGVHVAGLAGGHMMGFLRKV